jgi:antitoxin (DNA-binding transcriptional repressor) of toxin-antitoxin stability system
MIKDVRGRIIDKMRMSVKMSVMDTVSVRELQKNLAGVLSRVEGGLCLQVTRRRQVVAQLIPPVRVDKPEPWPDLDARARRVWGRRRVVGEAATAAILEGRGER